MVITLFPVLSKIPDSFNKSYSYILSGAVSLINTLMIALKLPWGQAVFSTCQLRSETMAHRKDWLVLSTVVGLPI